MSKKKVFFDGPCGLNVPDPRISKKGSAAPEALGFFWDIENVPVPKNVHLRDLIREFRNYYARLNFCEEIFEVPIRITEKKWINKNFSNHIKHLIAAGAKVCIAPPGKDGADRVIERSMDDFWHKNPNGLGVLITSDSGFSQLINRCRKRKNPIALIYNDYKNNIPVALELLSEKEQHMIKDVRGFDQPLSFFVQFCETEPEDKDEEKVADKAIQTGPAATSSEDSQISGEVLAAYDTMLSILDTVELRVDIRKSKNQAIAGCPVKISNQLEKRKAKESLFNNNGEVQTSSQF